MADRIQVNDWDGFRAALSQLNGLVQQVPTKRDAGSKVSAAAAAAADGEGTAAPVYAPSLTALGTAVDGCNVHVDAAAAAVQGVLAELEMLVNGMAAIDADGAQQVQNV